MYNEDSHGLGSSSSELESLEMIVVDNKTGETKWRTKYPNDLPFMSGDGYGALSNDGRFALANGEDDNDNNLLYLIDTKTGAHSQLNLRGSLEYDRVGDDDYWGSAWFSMDCSLISVLLSIITSASLVRSLASSGVEYGYLTTSPSWS